MLAVNAGRYIIVSFPHYDTGFIKDSSFVTCFINTGVPDIYITSSCTSFPGVDWILMKTTVNIPIGTTPKIKLTNLYWPRYVKNFVANVDCFKSYSINPGDYTRDLVSKCELMTLPLPKTLVKSKINAPKKGLNNVDCTYIFTFMSSNSIPQGSTIVITFPKGLFLIFISFVFIFLLFYYFNI